MSELLTQALFSTSGTCTGRPRPKGKDILAYLKRVAAQMAELEPPKPLNDDDEPNAILVNQQFLDKLIQEKYIHTFDKNCSNEIVVPVMNGFPVIVVPFIKTFRIITNKEYKQIYRFLIEKL